jgi:hypothetical protein
MKTEGWKLAELTLCRGAVFSGTWQFESREIYDRDHKQRLVPNLIEAIALKLRGVKTIRDLLRETLDFVGIIELMNRPAGHRK